MSKPARWSPPLKRACSIFRQRSGDDVEPGVVGDARRPRRSAGRAGSRSVSAPRRRPRVADVRQLGRRGGRRRRGRARPAGRPATGTSGRPSIVVLARRDEPDLVVRARRQQVGRARSWLARRGVRRRADDGDRAGPAQDRPAARARRRSRAARVTRPRRRSAERPVEVAQMSSASSMPTRDADELGAHARGRERLVGELRASWRPGG